MFSSKSVCQIFYMLIVFIHKISPYINANSNKFAMFYSSCVLLLAPSILLLLLFGVEKQVSSVRLDYYVSLCETFPSTIVLTSFLTGVREDRCRRREKERER